MTIPSNYYGVHTKLCNWDSVNKGCQFINIAQTSLESISIITEKENLHTVSMITTSESRHFTGGKYQCTSTQGHACLPWNHFIKKQLKNWGQLNQKIIPRSSTEI